ncbi:MAG TPA: hypothetical protein VFK73_03715 [Paludibacter sp.]|nr:hypothetical protein [Paludibacter sp.]
MKKKIILLLFFGVAVFAGAQQYYPTQKPRFVSEHDFRFGVGAKPFEAANITFGESFDFYDDSYFDAKDYYSGARYTTNSWFVEYIYQANSWFGVGATANYLAYYNKYYNGVTDKCIGSNVRKHFSVYPTIRFTWLRRKSFTAYSTFGIGQRLIFERDVTDGFDRSSRESGIAGQITLLGFTFGNRIYGFTDLATLGSQGMLNVGIGYRLTVPQKKK